MIYDFVIIGGGISGIATAELLSRKFKKLLLIEKGQKLCAESSRAHHEWFHTGSLYSTLDNNSIVGFALDNINSMIHYYGGFENMNLEFNELGKLEVSKKSEGWFNCSDFFYLMTKPGHPNLDEKIDLTKSWETRLESFSDFHHVINLDKPGNSLKNRIRGLLNQKEKNLIKYKETKCLEEIFQAEFKNFVVCRSEDKTINHFNITSDLVFDYQNNGGDIRLNCSFVGYKRLSDGIFEIENSLQQKILAKKIIFCTGVVPTNQLKGQFTSYFSPLLVVFPSLAKLNFVKIAPEPKNTINHVSHTHREKTYSLVGNGMYCSGSTEEKGKLQEILLSNAADIFPDFPGNKYFWKLYYGEKVEDTGLKNERERNYLTGTHKLENDVYAMCPGKYSFAFTGARKVYELATGEAPGKRKISGIAREGKDSSDLIFDTIHKEIIQNHILNTNG